MENNQQKHCGKDIIYQRPNHFSFLEDLRKNNKFCDVTIKVGEQTFRAHKIVLTGVIDYFEKMFSNNFLESNQEVITIKDIKPWNMELFLKFAYTGQITIKKANVQGLMIDASFLGLTDIMNKCSKFLESYLTPNNALEIYFLAEALSCTSLHDKSYKFVQENFLDISLEDQYLDLSINDLKEILSSKNLHAVSQEKVFEAVMRWVKNNVKERKKYLLDLLKIIELSKITDIYLVEKVIDDELIASLVECRDLVNKVIYNQIKLRNQRHILLITRTNRPVTGVYVNISSYDPITSNITEIKTMNNWGDKDNYIVYENKVYKLSTDIRRSSEVFDHKEASLKAISSMNIKSSTRVVALNGYLYACAKTNCERNTVERYCPMTDQWIRVTSLNYSRNDMAVVSLLGYIYVLGGFNNIYTYNNLNTVERYDPQSNKWIIMDSTMVEKRRSPGAGVLNEKIYVCGGFNGHETLSSVEVYDPKLNSWEYAASMNEARYSPVVVAHMNKLWVFGGQFVNYEVLSSAEVYDPVNNIWSYVSLMDKKLHFLAGGVISRQ